MSSHYHLDPWAARRNPRLKLWTLLKCSSPIGGVIKGSNYDSLEYLRLPCSPCRRFPLHSYKSLLFQRRRHGFDSRTGRQYCQHVQDIPVILSATTTNISLLDGQSISNEICHSSRRRRIQVRQHSNYITWPGADLQLAIHPRRATAMAEASGPINRRLLKSISIFAAVRCLDFPRR